MTVRAGFAVATALGLVGAGAVYFATTVGIGVSPDSIAYLSAAQALSEGRALLTIAGERWVPLTHYPPLFPAFAALGPLLGACASGWLRGLHALLFLVVVLLAAVASWRASGRESLAPALTALALVTAKDVVYAFCMAWSEPLFLALMLACLLWTARCGVVRARTALVAAAAFAGAAVLTRYAGVSLIAFGVFTILSAGRHSMRGRLQDAIVFSGLSVLPVALWATRNTLVAGSATSRELAFHPLPWSVYLGGAGTISEFFTRSWHWIVLDEIPRNLQLAGCVTAGLAILAGAFATRSGSDEERVFHRAVAAFVAVHIATLVAAGAFQDHSIVFDHRQMLPVHVAGIVVVVALVLRITAGRRWWRGLAVALLVIHGGAGIRLTAPWVVEAHQEGLELNSRRWKQSPLLARIRALPPGVALATNAADAIYHHTGRLSRELPERMNRISARPNPRYQRELRDLAATLGPGGAVVWFGTVPWRTYLPDHEELSRVPGLTEKARVSDGSLFVVGQ